MPCEDWASPCHKQQLEERNAAISAGAGGAGRTSMQLLLFCDYIAMQTLCTYDKALPAIFCSTWLLLPHFFSFLAGLPPAHGHLVYTACFAGSNRAVAALGVGCGVDAQVSAKG